jgi:hypothetical protein
VAGLFWWITVERIVWRKRFLPKADLRHTRVMVYESLPQVSAHALGWPVVLLELLPPTQTIEVSTGWLVALLVALAIWRGRMRR